MPLFIDIVNTSLSILTVAGQVTFLVVILNILFNKKYEQGVSAKFFARNAMMLAFVVSLVATLGSLFYSEIAGYNPCKLCWFQRILMYPQVILLGMALWRKETNIRVYAVVLSVFGAIIALYHYYLQLGGDPLIPCGTVGYSVDCSARFVLEYGYITIPMMALTAFVLIGSVCAFSIHTDKKIQN